MKKEKSPWEQRELQKEQHRGLQIDEPTEEEEAHGPKRRKKVVIGESKELQGFEDVLDLVNIRDTTIYLDQSDPIYKVKGVEFLNFLEKEYERLKHIHNFFSQKIENIKDYPQEYKLIEQEEERFEHLKDEILNLAVPDKSYANESMARIFNYYL